MLPGAVPSIAERTLLGGIAARWQMTLSAEQEQRLLVFADLLVEWNQHINLTGAQTSGDVVADHFPDSFAMARLVPTGARLIDVGSGGGLPVLPLAVLRADLEVALVEPRNRRVAFLRTAIRTMGLTRATVIGARVESLGRPNPPYDCASSRATFPPEMWLPMGFALVGPGGAVITFAAEPQGPRLTRYTAGEELLYGTGSGRSRWAALYRST